MKKIHLIAVLVAIAVAAIAAPASAQFYIGGGLGKSFGSDGNTSAVIGTTTVVTSGLDNNKTSYQINGGYEFTPIWGVEVQYTDLGKRSGIATFSGGVTGTAAIPDTKLYQWGISGTGTLAINEDWFARGKLGVSSNHIDNSTATLGGVTFSTGGGSKTDLLLGAAIGYRWNKNFSTRLEYEYFGKFSSNSGNATSNVKANNIGLRLQYSFQ